MPTQAQHKASKIGPNHSYHILCVLPVRICVTHDMRQVYEVLGTEEDTVDSCDTNAGFD